MGPEHERRTTKMTMGANQVRGNGDEQLTTDPHVSFWHHEPTADAFLAVGRLGADASCVTSIH